jgi:hypothetical protein
MWKLARTILSSSKTAVLITSILLGAMIFHSVRSPVRRDVSHGFGAGLDGGREVDRVRGLEAVAGA